MGKAEVVGGSVGSLKLLAQAGEQGRLVVEKELLKGGRLLLLGVKVLVEENLVAGVVGRVPESWESCLGS